MQIPFRNDDYRRSFFIEDDNGWSSIPYCIGTTVVQDLCLDVTEVEYGGVLHISATCTARTPRKVRRFGLRLGIDCYMASYPEWNEKFFPTALRCERQGFWGCLMSPMGKRIAICAPSGIVSWRNEYSQADDDIVGHRIYTVSVDLVNTAPQPPRHPVSPDKLAGTLHCDLYLAQPESDAAFFSFVEQYANIHVPQVNKFTLEPGETLWIDGNPYHGALRRGVNTITADGAAELTVYVRQPWRYYLECANASAEACQQKPGTNCESWYGYFTRALYAKQTGDDGATRRLTAEFDRFFHIVTEKQNGVYRMRKETLPVRLQNTSTMLSLLADFYELTGDGSYLDKAADLAEWLMSLQAADGSYRKRRTHYTCVIYPAKSMLELALAELQAGRTALYRKHYDSACRAIWELERSMDNIQTEGQMTFEDGMISCESLQLGYLALLLPEGTEKTALTQASARIMQKHRCLEQHYLPDCRVRGCTARFWEARYDVNFFANMLNMPHGWTSWKTYATYYLYLLTGDPVYLKDTMDTLGACMQCVDETGCLRWGYTADPCVRGMRLSRDSAPENIILEEAVVGECYLPMISDWWRQDDTSLILQYLAPYDAPEQWDALYGGSCDNDVHEHFKCLMETVYGKAFIHLSPEAPLLYNCRMEQGNFVTDDPDVTTWIIWSDRETELTVFGRRQLLHPGFQFLSCEVTSHF